MAQVQVIFALLLSMLPVFELRGAIPLLAGYSVSFGIPFIPYAIAAIFLNILAIFFIFFFLDYLHEKLMAFNFYGNFFKRYLVRAKRRARKIESRFSSIGFFALFLFVAVPFPGTGAWTGCIVSWLLGLSRKKSIVAISLGVLFAGLVVLFGSLGVLAFFK